MLKTVGCLSADELCNKTIPNGIEYTLNTINSQTEQSFESHLHQVSKKQSCDPL